MRENHFNKSVMLPFGIVAQAKALPEKPVFLNNILELNNLLPTLVEFANHLNLTCRIFYESR